MVWYLVKAGEKLTLQIIQRCDTSHYAGTPRVQQH